MRMPSIACACGATAGQTPSAASIRRDSASA